MDVYAWWIDCDRSGKEDVDMDPAAFVLESGTHTTQPTGIEDVQNDQVQSTKVLRDGQLYIIHNGQTYDVQGRRITE